MLLRCLWFLLALYASSGLSQAAQCPRPDALGTARTMTVDTTGGLHVGRFQYPATLKLARGEVVLTFDDGPSSSITPRVLKALADQCVKATFFMIGRNAAANPAIAQSIALQGHTVAHHSMTHPAPMTALAPDVAINDIVLGMNAVRASLGPLAAGSFAPGFFRYPGLWNPPAVDHWLAQRGIGVFGIDVHARDWELKDPQAILALMLQRLETQGSGILLLHDIHPQTAAMVPQLLIELKRRGYRVVHVVPEKNSARH